MKSTWIKIVLMTAISLHLAACGKKKSDGGVSAPQETQTQPAPTTGETSDTTGQDAQTTIPAPGRTADTNNETRDKKEDKDKDKKDVKSVDQNDNSNAQPASSLSEEKYSGSAEDYLRSFLIAQEAQLSESQLNLNKKAAQSIQSTSLKIDYNNTGDVALSLKFKSGNENKSAVLGGIMKSDRTSSMKSSKEKLSAQLKCMDVADPVYKDCETALVTLKLNGGNVNIIFRRTNMHVKADFGHKQCLTQECENIFSVFKQTEEGIIDSLTLSKVKLETTEIIHSRSSFRGILRTRGGDAIVIGGDLLNEDLYPTMNLQADRAMNMEDLVDLQNMTNLKTDIHRSLSDIRIVGNNGQGKIQMRVNMKVLSDGSRDTFDLTFDRISLPISSTVIQLN